MVLELFRANTGVWLIVPCHDRDKRTYVARATRCPPGHCRCESATVGTCTPVVDRAERDEDTPYKMHDGPAEHTYW